MVPRLAGGGGPAGRSGLAGCRSSCSTGGSCWPPRPTPGRKGCGGGCAGGRPKSAARGSFTARSTPPARPGPSRPWSGPSKCWRPRLTLDRPGLLFVPTRGPSRYFGGDEAFAARVLAEAAGVLSGGSSGSGVHFGRTGGENERRLPPAADGARVGVADGVFAARLAARRAMPGGAFVVPAGETPAFLAPWPVRVLDDDDLAGLLVRLGLPTLGDVRPRLPAGLGAGPVRPRRPGRPPAGPGRRGASPGVTRPASGPGAPPRVRPAGLPGRHGGVRRPGSGRAAPRVAGRRRPRLHPGPGGGRDRARRAPGPELAAVGRERGGQRAPAVRRPRRARRSWPSGSGGSSRRGSAATRAPVGPTAGVAPTTISSPAA